MSSELEAQIYERPDDPGAYVVYGDWLQNRGDPRGKLITAQAARLAALDSEELAAAELAIIHEHRDQLLGPLLDVQPEPRVQWYLGYWRALAMGGFGWSAKPTRDEHVAELLGHASAKFLRAFAYDGGASTAVLGYVAEKHRTIERVDVLLRDPEIDDAALAILSPCSRLQRLHLFSCPRVSPDGLAVLQRFRGLRDLDLRNCTLSDRGARHLAGLPLERVMFNVVEDLAAAGMRVFAAQPLISLDLDGDNLDDTAVAALTGHPSLVNLELGSAAITDVGAGAIGWMPKLRRLYLRSCRELGDAGVRALAAHAQLRALYLGHCGSLTDASCEALGAMTTLRFLDLKSNQITAAGLRALRGLGELRVLDLAFLDLGDDAVRELAAFPQLAGLNLGYSHVTDAALDVITQLASLETLDLSGSAITAAGIERLARMPNLTELGLEECASAVQERARAYEHWSVATRDLLELWDDEDV